MSDKYFITLFNYNYLPQGITMFKSLKQNLPSAKLWVVCMDDKVELFLKKKNYKDLHLISLNKLENKKLLKVKKKRKFVEFCWTLTPFLPSFFFKKFKTAKAVTYLDADMFFYKKLNPIFKEFKNSKKSVFLTEHNFHEKHDFSEVTGKFSVQFMIFRNNKESKRILKWWQAKCLDWCYDYPDKGRLGDQKYLDQWPKLFKNSIHILKNKKFFQAPWTLDRFKSNDAIVYHFHGLKIQLDKIHVINKYGFTKNIIQVIYLPYCKSINKSLKKINYNFRQMNFNYNFFSKVKFFLKVLFSAERKIYHYIFDLK